MVVETQKRKCSFEVNSGTPLTAMSGFHFSDSSKSAFSPYKPEVTVLTNLQRGNTKAKINCHEKELSFFQLAAKGELTMDQIMSWDDFDAFDCGECGLTALMWASSYGQSHTCEDLLGAGATVDACNSRGQTALHFAAKAGYPEVVKVLVSFGADINFSDERGNTALIFACRGNHPLTVSFLLTNGADFAAVNYDGRCAYVEVIDHRYCDVQSILENHMKQLLTGDFIAPNPSR